MADAPGRRRLAFAIPGDLALPTGGYGYDRRLIAELVALGRDVVHVRLPDGFPDPTDDERDRAEAALAELPAGLPLMVDGLAFGVMDSEARALAARHPLVALVHHPLALETGLAPARAAALRDSEREALRHARRVIVTSPATGQSLAADFAVPHSRIVVAVPGTDPAPFAAGSGGPGVRLLAVGSLLPRKGHLDLIAALSALRGLDWRLDLVGDPGLDPAHAAAIRAAIVREGLEARIELVGALDRGALDSRYHRADVFVLASHYEGYGMAYAEAIARGLPVVGTTGGAIAGTVGAAAELVAPGDVAALTAVLDRLIADPAHRAGRAAIARAVAPSLPSWRGTAEIVASVLDAALAEGSV